MNWVKTRLRKWLGIDKNTKDIYRHHILLEDLVHIGVDVHFKKPHMILIYSKLKGGQIRHIDAHFDNLRELNTFVKELKNRYNTRSETWDVPPSMNHFLHHKY